VVCSTGQHRQMLDQVQTMLGLRPDVDLGLMRPGQSLNELAGRAFAAIDSVLGDQRPDWVLVQGDTTTAFVGAIAAFHRGIPVGHVEAGLRTGDLARPFPEEANRRIIDVVSAALFAPTGLAAERLVGEGVPAERVHVTGNTGIDALLAIERLCGSSVEGAGDVLVTLHRRESFGQPVEEVCAALRDLAERFPAVRWIYPVHPNPNVKEVAHRVLAGLVNVELHEPFDPIEMARRLRSCRLVLTDSGGLQEEAPVFGKPVLVLREMTERPEGVAAGVSLLVGTDRQRIVAETSRLLTDERAYQRMAQATNPYGDGRAAERIAAILAGEPWEPWVR
jgi:UDP-N-acetylglucosamine 2-epimerase (non-hydrolysing)